MKRSLSLILAIAVILASAFLLAPIVVRSEDPPTPALHPVEKEISGWNKDPVEIWRTR